MASLPAVRLSPSVRPRTEPPREGRLPTLDGWRGIAILLVLFAHLQLPGGALRPYAPYGSLGVQLFFSLSGLVITHRLIVEGQRDGRVNWLAFYTRRSCRILLPAGCPLVVLACLGFVLRTVPLDSGQWLSALLFWRNYHASTPERGWYTGHYWSLAVEEHFYLLWPALLAAAGLRHGRWLAPLSAAAFACWRWADLRHGWVASFAPALRGAASRSDYQLDGLFWGCAAAYCWHSRQRLRLLRIPAPTLLLLLSVSCIVWCASAPGSEPRAVLPVFMALLPLLTLAQPDSLAGRLLQSAGCVWLGRISFSLYLWQQFFLPTYGVGAHLGVLQRFPLNVCLALLCGWAGERWIERPSMRLGRRLAARLQPVTSR